MQFSLGSGSPIYIVHRSSAATASASMRPSIATPHLLLVWSELAPDGHLADMLRQHDLHVILVSEAAQTHRLLSLCNVDVLIVDVTHPGCDAAYRWRQLCSAEGPPVILLAPQGCEPGAVEALQAGAADYLNKPFNTRELLARIRGLLRRSLESRGWTSGTESPVVSD